MIFQKLKPILYTRELKATIDFYTSSLGFTVNGGNESDWISLERDLAEIMFSLPNAHAPFEKAFCTGSFYITVDDVDEMRSALNNTVKIVYETENFDYGMREFAVYDNNGYILQFGQYIGEAKNT
jgi:catechol 2,3-dioxygenase-like lactoylglutathione lyase family enzyme